MLTTCKAYFEKYRELLLYLVFGGLTTVVSIGSYLVLTRVIFALGMQTNERLYVQLSTVLAWVLAVTFAYITNKLFVFRSHRDIVEEIVSFYTARFLSLVVEMLIMWVFATLLGIDDMIVKLGANVVVVIFNYIAGKFVVFRKRAGTEGVRFASVAERRLYLCHLILLAVGAAVLVIIACGTAAGAAERAYAERIADHGFSDLLRAAAGEGRPPLYDLLLKAWSMVLGDGVVIDRLFSVLGAVLLAAVGVTLLRRDFGGRTGLVFSALVLPPAAVFCAASARCAYTWAALFAVLAFAFAWRALQATTGAGKNRVLFCLFAAAAAYTHIGGLAAVCVLDVFLLLFAVVRREKYPRALLPLVLCVAVQALALVPGLVYVYRIMERFPVI